MENLGQGRPVKRRNTVYVHRAVDGQKDVHEGAKESVSLDQG